MERNGVSGDELEHDGLTPGESLEAAMLSLPYRAGEKPKTSPSAPHEQLDQNPPANVYALLKDRAFDFPQVDRRPSIISVSGAEGLWLTTQMTTPSSRTHHRVDTCAVDTRAEAALRACHAPLRRRASQVCDFPLSAK